MNNVPKPQPDRADKLAYYMIKSVNKAVRRYRMIADGDAILVATSGGKDSMTLLDLLHRRRRSSREHYTLAAARILTDSHCGSAVPLEWQREWCAERGIPFETESIAIAQELLDTTASKCFRCAWNRRKALFGMAERLRCNVLAFGHHADDIAQTTLMNLFYSGRLFRMEPRVRFFQGRLLLIRPLAFVEERDIVPFARASGYPISGERCPEGGNSRRNAVRRVLRELERETPRIKRSIHSAVEHHNWALRNAGAPLRGDEPPSGPTEAPDNTPGSRQGRSEVTWAPDGSTGPVQSPRLS